MDVDGAVIREVLPQIDREGRIFGDSTALGQGLAFCRDGNCAGEQQRQREEQCEERAFPIITSVYRLPFYLLYLRFVRFVNEKKRCGAAARFISY